MKRSLACLGHLRRLLIIVILGLFRDHSRKFFPEEDQGYFITIVQLPDGASKKRTDRGLEQDRKLFPVESGGPFDGCPVRPKFCLQYAGHQSRDDVRAIAALG